MGKLRTLGVIVAATVGLGTGVLVANGGIYQNPEYHFNGKIGEEQVHFDESIFGANYLEVVKADGSKIRYEALGSDFELDSVHITIGDSTTKYSWSSKNPIIQRVLQNAQNEFRWYLKKITEIQTAPLNDNTQPDFTLKAEKEQ